ncbi:MAG: alpha/beta hydrolase [Planctomycetaceae bacterium]|nr:alpha/beta hydrolase [Planctomycetaceae bacterium]
MSSLESKPLEQPGKASRSWLQFVGSLLRRLLLLIALCYLGIVCLFATMQRWLIYSPNPAPVQPEEVRLDPALVESFQLHSEGEQLEGWYCSTQRGFGDVRRCAILFPGNAGNRGNRASIIQQWNELGYDVVIVDYRGYGGSSGKPSEAAFAADSRAVWDYVTQERQFDPKDVVICGQSLGGAVGIRLVHDLETEGVRPAGLVVRASFTSLVDAGRYHYPWLPVNLVLLDRFPSLDRISAIQCPLLFLHGQRDTIVPFEHSSKLFANAPEASHNGVAKRLVPLPNAGHNDIMHVHGDDVTEAVRQFLSDVAAVQ